MSQTSMLHARVGDKLKADAAATLANFGLTVSDAASFALLDTTRRLLTALPLSANAVTRRLRVPSCSFFSQSSCVA